MSFYVTGFLIDDGLARYLGPLKATGLYGETDDEVLASLIREGVHRAVASKFVEVLFAEDEEEAAAPEKPPCPTCNDTWANPGVCPACGSDGIPF